MKVQLRKLCSGEEGYEAGKGRYGLFSGNTSTGFYVDAEDIRVPSDGEDRIYPGDQGSRTRDDDGKIRREWNSDLDEPDEYRIDHQGGHAGIFRGKQKLGKVDAKSLRQFKTACETVGWPKGDDGDDDAEAQKASEFFHKRLQPDGTTTLHPADSGPMEPRKYGLADPYFDGPELTRFINDRYAIFDGLNERLAAAVAAHMMRESSNFAQSLVEVTRSPEMAKLWAERSTIVLKDGIQ